MAYSALHQSITRLLRFYHQNQRQRWTQPFLSFFFFRSLSFLVYGTAMGPQLSAAVAAQVQMAVAGGNSPTTPPVVSPMANLMSITDTLPPGSPRNGPSPPQQAPQRSASRGSQHSTHSSGTEEYVRSMFMLSCCSSTVKRVLVVDLVIGGRFWGIN